MKNSKKMICLLLVLVMILALVGCNAGTPKETTGNESENTEETNGGQVADTGFRVGYARIDITPTESVPLGGYGNTERRMSTGFLNYLYAYCIAITDGNDNTVLLYAVDLIRVASAYNTLVKNAVQEATGVPKDNIMINASHTHSAPDTTKTSMTCIQNYNNFLAKQMAQAAVEALEDRKPAEMYVGSAETEKLNYVRRYEMVDGSFAGDNFGNWDLEVKAHESEADREMRVIQFKRDGGQDVVLISWQSHPHMTGGATKYDVSSDIVGAMNDFLSSNTEFLTAYFQGGAGNINPWSNWDADNYSRSSLDWRKVGQSLATTALNILNTKMTQVETGEVKTSKATYTGTVNHEQDNLYAIAKQVSDIWSSTNDKSAAMAIGAEYGIQSVYHANHIISKAGKGLTQDLEVNVAAIGDVAFTFAPYEQFDTNAKFIRDNSPYTMTFALGYSNDMIGYMPSAQAFPHSGYEVTSCPFVAGTGEEIADLMLDMLGQLHG